MRQGCDKARCFRCGSGRLMRDETMDGLGIRACLDCGLEFADGEPGRGPEWWSKARNAWTRSPEGLLTVLASSEA